MPYSNLSPDARAWVHDLMDRYRSRITLLPDKPEETLEATVRALSLCATGTPTSAGRAATLPQPSLNRKQRKWLTDSLERRAGGVPLAHLTGLQNFMGLDFICSAQALIPRQETEILGNAALTILEKKTLPERPRVMDLCTGSGNLACALATHIPQCAVFAADLSPEAVELAGRNACQLGCADRVTLLTGDLFAPFESGTFYGSFDLITCNPPYITSAKLPSMDREIVDHEPNMAFDAGPLGLSILWRLLQESPRFLKPGGWLAFEVGQGQGHLLLLQRLAKNAQFTNVEGTNRCQRPCPRHHRPIRPNHSKLRMRSWIFRSSMPSHPSDAPV